MSEQLGREIDRIGDAGNRNPGRSRRRPIDLRWGVEKRGLAAVVNYPNGTKGMLRIPTVSLQDRVDAERDRTEQEGKN